jgi:hypothetical protein
MTDAPPKIGDTPPAPDGELCPKGGKHGCPAREVVHISAENLRNLRRLAARQEALGAEIGRQAALWRAGVRYGTGANLLLQHLPDDLDLDDVEAVRAACSTIVAAVLGARDELAEVGS